MMFVPVVLILVVVSALWLWTPDKSRTELEARYLNAPGDLMDVASVQLHVRDSGAQDAPVVILIHGFGSSLHTWEPWAKALSAEYRVIRFRFDLPGFGLSQPDPTGDYTDARSLQLLAALMDRLGVTRATLIGNSIGGRIAWTFAAETPERIDKLVLASHPTGLLAQGWSTAESRTCR